MSTIAEQLVALAQCKADIKAAIIAKGVSVSDSDPFSDYATKIGQISGGGGGGDSSLIEKWDFDETGSLVGEKGTTATLSGATIATGTGVTFSGATNYLDIPAYLLKPNRKIEIEFGTMAYANRYYGYVISWGTSLGVTFGLEFSSGDVWRMETTGVDRSSISTSNYFQNSKMTIVIDANSKAHIYRDDVLVWEPPTALNIDGIGYWRIGNHNMCYITMIVRSIAIYSTEDIGKIADFDFKTGLTDSVNGFNATLSGTGITRDSSGVHYTSPGDRIVIPPVLFGILRSYEIKTGSMSNQGTTSALFGYSPSTSTYTHGFAYHGATGKWGVWDSVSSTWRDSDISDANYFANSVVKIEIGADRLWKIYKDDVLCFEPTGAFPMDGVVSFAIGGPGNNSFYNMTIEGLVIRSK